MVEELGELIGQRNGPAVARIAEQHPRVLFEANAYGVVPLMTAAFHGDLPACQAMVQVGQDSHTSEHTTGLGLRVLLCVCAGGRGEAVAAPE